MKRLFVFTALLLIAGYSFGQTSKTSSVDMKTEAAAVNELIDKYETAVEALDVSTFISLLSEEAIVCGTDPSEFWNKQEYKNLWEQSSSGPMPEFTSIDDRKTIVSPGGKSAIVVTQYIIGWSPKIPWRQVYHCVIINDNWLIQFINIAFIPKNEDIQTINEAID